jgi:hypothetical protein
MGREGTAIGMFDSIECNYPLPLPLEVVDILPDPYDQEFQTKDLENLLDLYYLNEDGVLYWRKRKYEWKNDDSAILKGYMDVVDEEVVPTDFHGVLNFYCYETVHEDESSDKAKDVTIDYLAKFTNGKLENIEVLSYEIIDATVRIIDLKYTMKKHEERRNRWYNKYIFYTKFWRFVKNKVILASISFLKTVLDKLYWFIVRYL